MKVKILKTSAKHYAEKKLRSAPQSMPARLYVIDVPDTWHNAKEDVFLKQPAKCKQNFFWHINRYKNVDQLPPQDLKFIQKWIAQDWNLNLNIEHDFNVMRRIVINSIINN